MFLPRLEHLDVVVVQLDSKQVTQSSSSPLGLVDAEEQKKHFQNIILRARKHCTFVFCFESPPRN